MPTYVPNPDDDRLWYGLLSSWLLALEAENKSDRTIGNYRWAPLQFHAWLVQTGQGTDDVRDITPELVRAWLADIGKRWTDSTAAARYVGLRQWCHWLIAEGEVETDPMANVRKPSVGEKVAHVLSPDEVDALLSGCEGSDFTDVRDRAILMLFADTGMRLGACAGIKLPELDLRERVVAIHTKGDRHLVVPFGANTARALDRYLRARRRAKWAELQWLWLSTNNKGHLTANGITQMLRRRGAKAGVPGLHPHMFRHTFADRWLDAGGSETGLMDIAGWKSRQMVGRYAAARRAERARAEHRRLSPMDNR
jgi:site-specific recombinase XerD